MNPKLLDKLNIGIKKGKVRNKVRDIPWTERSEYGLSIMAKHEETCDRVKDNAHDVQSVIVDANRFSQQNPKVL